MLVFKSYAPTFLADYAAYCILPREDYGRHPELGDLGPVAVLPVYQRRSIGKALIQEGLSRLKDLDAQGCCLVGHPDYYRKFGFKNMPGLVHEGVPKEVFFALSFDCHSPQGTVTFHEGFKSDGQQEGSGDALQCARL